MTACATQKTTSLSVPPPASGTVVEQATYATAKEVTAMTPRTAKFTKILSEYSGSFTMADGRTFILGDQVGDQWVWHFLVTLKEGQTYKLPEAFVNYQNAPSYVTIQEIVAMAPRTGTLAARSPCSSCFTTTDGKGFYIGDPGSGPQVSHFIGSLENGRSYEFPKAFLQYQKAHPLKED